MANSYYTNRTTGTVLGAGLTRELGTGYNVGITHNAARDAFLVSISHMVGKKSVDLSFWATGGQGNGVFNQPDSPAIKLVTGSSSGQLPAYDVTPVVLAQVDQVDKDLRVQGLEYMNPVDVINRMIRKSYKDYEAEIKFRPDYSIQSAWSNVVQHGITAGNLVSGQYSIPGGMPVETSTTGPSEAATNAHQLRVAVSLTDPRKHPGPLEINELQSVQNQILSMMVESRRPGATSGMPDAIGWDREAAGLSLPGAMATLGMVPLKMADEGAFSFQATAVGARVDELGNIQNFSNTLKNGVPSLKGRTGVSSNISGRAVATPIGYDYEPIAAQSIGNFWETGRARFANLNIILPGEDRPQKALVSAGLLAVGYPAMGGGGVYAETLADAGIKTWGFEKNVPVDAGSNVRDFISGTNNLSLNIANIQQDMIIGNRHTNVGSIGGEELGFRTTAGAMSINKINVSLPAAYNAQTGETAESTYVVDPITGKGSYIPVGSGSIGISEDMTKAIKERIINQQTSSGDPMYDEQQRKYLNRVLSVSTSNTAQGITLNLQGMQHTDEKPIGGQKTGQGLIYMPAPKVTLAGTSMKIGELTSEVKNGPMMFALSMGALTSKMQSNLLEEYANTIQGISGNVGQTDISYSDVALNIMNEVIPSIKKGRPLNMEHLVPSGQGGENVGGSAWSISNDIYNKIFRTPTPEANKRNLQNYGMGWVGQQDTGPAPLGTFSEEQFTRYKRDEISFLRSTGMSATESEATFNSQYQYQQVDTPRGSTYKVALTQPAWAHPDAAIPAVEYPGGGETTKVANYELMAAVSAKFPGTAKNLGIYLGPNNPDPNDPTKLSSSPVIGRALSKRGDPSIAAWRDIGLFHSISNAFQEHGTVYTGDRIQQVAPDTLIAAHYNTNLTTLLAKKGDLNEEEWKQIAGEMKNTGMDPSKILYAPGTGEQPYLPSLNSLSTASSSNLEGEDRTGYMQIYRNALKRVVDSGGGSDKATQYSMDRMLHVFDPQFNSKSNVMKQITGGEVPGMLIDRYRFQPWLKENEVYLPDQEMYRMAANIAEAQGMGGNAEALHAIVKKIQSGKSYGTFTRYPMESREESTFGVKFVTDVQAKQSMGVEEYAIQKRAGGLGGSSIGVGFVLGEIESPGDFDYDQGAIMPNVRAARVNMAGKRRIIGIDTSDKTLRDSTDAGFGPNADAYNAMFPDKVQADLYNAWQKHTSEIFEGAIVNGKFDPELAAHNLMGKHFDVEGGKMGFTDLANTIDSGKEDVETHFGMATSYNTVRKLEAGAIVSGMPESKISPLIRSRAQEYSPYLDRLLRKSKPFTAALNSTYITKIGNLKWRDENGNSVDDKGYAFLSPAGAAVQPITMRNNLASGIGKLAEAMSTPMEGKFGSANELLALGFTPGGLNSANTLDLLNQATSGISDDISTFSGKNKKERTTTRARAIGSAQLDVIQKQLAGYSQEELERTPAAVAALSAAMGRKYVGLGIEDVQEGGGKELMRRASVSSTMYQLLTLRGMPDFDQFQAAVSSGYISNKNSGGSMMLQLWKSFGHVNSESNAIDTGADFYSNIFNGGSGEPLEMRASRMLLERPEDAGRFILENVGSASDREFGTSTRRALENAASIYHFPDQTKSQRGLDAEEGYNIYQQGQGGGWTHAATGEGISITGTLPTGEQVKIGAHPDFLRYDRASKSIMAMEMKTGGQISDPDKQPKISMQLKTQLAIIARMGQYAGEADDLAESYSTVFNSPATTPDEIAKKNRNLDTIDKKRKAAIQMGYTPLTSLAHSMGVTGAHEVEDFIGAAKSYKISGNVLKVQDDAALAFQRMAHGVSYEDLESGEKTAINRKDAVAFDKNMFYDLADETTRNDILSGPNSVMATVAGFFQQLKSDPHRGGADAMTPGMADATKVVTSPAYEEMIANASPEQRKSLEATQQKIIAMNSYTMWKQRNPSVTSAPTGQNAGVAQAAAASQGAQQPAGATTSAPVGATAQPITGRASAPAQAAAANWSLGGTGSAFSTGPRFTRTPTANAETELAAFNTLFEQNSPNILAGAAAFRSSIGGAVNVGGVPFVEVPGGIAEGAAGSRIEEIAKATQSPTWLNQFPGAIRAASQAAGLHQTAARLQGVLDVMPVGSPIRDEAQLSINRVLDRGTPNPVSLAIQDLETVHKVASGSKGYEALGGVRGAFMDMAQDELQKSGVLGKLQNLKSGSSIGGILGDSTYAKEVQQIMTAPENIGAVSMAMKAVNIAGKDNQFLDPTLAAIGATGTSLKTQYPGEFKSDIVGEKSWRATDPQGLEDHLNKLNDALKNVTAQTEKFDKMVSGATSSTEKQIQAQDKVVKASEAYHTALGKELDARKELASQAVEHPSAFDAQGRPKSIQEMVSAGVSGVDAAKDIQSLYIKAGQGGALSREARLDQAVADQGLNEAGQGLAGHLGSFARRTLGGFGLMYMRSIASIVGEPLQSGYQEAVQANQVYGQAAVGAFGGTPIQNPDIYRQRVMANMQGGSGGIMTSLAMSNFIKNAPGTYNMGQSLLSTAAAGGATEWAAQNLGMAAAEAAPIAGVVALGVGALTYGLNVSAAYQDTYGTSVDMATRYAGASASQKQGGTWAVGRGVLNMFDYSAMQYQLAKAGLGNTDIATFTDKLNAISDMSAKGSTWGQITQALGISPSDSSKYLQGAARVTSANNPGLQGVSDTAAAQAFTLNALYGSNTNPFGEDFAKQAAALQSGFNYYDLASQMLSTGRGAGQVSAGLGTARNNMSFMSIMQNQVARDQITAGEKFRAGLATSWNDIMPNTQAGMSNRIGEDRRYSMYSPLQQQVATAQSAVNDIRFRMGGTAIPGYTPTSTYDQNGNLSGVGSLSPTEAQGWLGQAGVAYNQASMYQNLVQAGANSSGSYSGAQAQYGYLINGSQAALQQATRQQASSDQMKANLQSMGLMGIGQQDVTPLWKTIEQWKAPNGLGESYLQRSNIFYNLSQGMAQAGTTNFGMSPVQSQKLSADTYTGMENGQISAFRGSVLQGAMSWDKMSMTQAQAYGYQVPGFGGGGNAGFIPGQLIQGDVNQVGMPTGLGLFSTSMNQGNPNQPGGISGQQTATSMWGANWSTTGSAYSQTIKNAMVNGYATGTNGQIVGGQVGAAAAQENINYGLSMASVGNQMAQLQLNQSFTTGVGISQYAGIVNPQTGKPFGFNTGTFGFNVPGAGSYTSQGGGTWGLEDTQRNLGYAQQNWQFGMQQRQINLQASQFGENMALQSTQMQTQRSWQKQDYAFQDVQRGEQRTWAVEDFAEESRFMTGRQRRLAERDFKRQTTLFNQDTEQIGRTRGRDEQGYQWEVQRFDLENKHFEENKKLQQESLDMDKKFFETRKELEQESVDLQRAEWTNQIQLQKESVGIQATQIQNAHDQAKIDQDIQNTIRDTNTLVIAAQKQFGDGTLATFQNVYEWVKKTADLIGKPISSLPTGSPANPGGNTTTPTTGGDPAMPSEAPKKGYHWVLRNHVWVQEQDAVGSIPNITISSNSVPSTSTVWSRTTVSGQAGSPVGGGSATPIIQVFIGNEQLDSYVVRAVNQEIAK